MIFYGVIAWPAECIYFSQTSPIIIFFEVHHFIYVSGLFVLSQLFPKTEFAVF